MNGFLKRLWRTLETGAALTLGLMAALVIYQVGARYLFGSPPSWTEELARFLQVWLVLLALAGVPPARDAPRRGLRIAPASEGRRVALRTGVLLISAVFCLAFAVYGTRLLAVAGLQTSPALGISMIWPYLAVPVSGVLMAVAAAVLIVSEIRGTTGQESDGESDREGDGP